MRILFDEHLVDGAAGINGVAENVGEHFALGETFVLGIKTGAGNHRIDEVLLILAVHDGKARRKTRGFGMPAENAIADGMKRAAPQAGEVVGQKVRHAVEHLAGGLVSEGEQEDILGQNAGLEKKVDPVSEGARFPAPGAGDDQCRTRRSAHRGQLLRI